MNMERYYNTEMVEDYKKMFDSFTLEELELQLEVLKQAIKERRKAIQELMYLEHELAENGFEIRGYKDGTGKWRNYIIKKGESK